jgi:hypothetical protein
LLRGQEIPYFYGSQWFIALLRHPVTGFCQYLVEFSPHLQTFQSKVNFSTTPSIYVLPLTWSLTLREEQRLRVFENRVLRRIFGPTRDKVTGGSRKLHNEKLHGLYCSPSIIRVIKARRMRWAGHVARMEEARGAYNILVGRTEGRRPLGRPRRRREDNIKMDLREIGFGDVDWIHWA